MRLRHRRAPGEPSVCIFERFPVRDPINPFVESESELNVGTFAFED